MILSLILGILVGGISVIFILQNIATVTVTFFTWQIAGSLAVVLLLAFLSGIVMTLLFILPSLIKDDFYLSAIKKQKKELEDQLAKTKVALADANARATRAGSADADKTYPVA